MVSVVGVNPCLLITGVRVTSQYWQDQPTTMMDVHKASKPRFVTCYIPQGEGYLW